MKEDGSYENVGEENMRMHVVEIGRSGKTVPIVDVHLAVVREWNLSFKGIEQEHSSWLCVNRCTFIGSKCPTNISWLRELIIDTSVDFICACVSLGIYWYVWTYSTLSIFVSFRLFCSSH